MHLLHEPILIGPFTVMQPWPVYRSSFLSPYSISLLNGFFGGVYPRQLPGGVAVAWSRS